MSKLAEWPLTCGIAVAVSGDTAIVGRGFATLPVVRGRRMSSSARAAAGRALPAFSADGEPGDFFGTAVGISGGTIIAGAIGDAEAGAYSGSAYIMELNGDGRPWLARSPADQTITAGAAVTFSVAAFGADRLSYQWCRDGVALADDGHFMGTGTNTLTIDPAGPADAGQYDVVVSSLCGEVTMPRRHSQFHAPYRNRKSRRSSLARAAARLRRVRGCGGV